MAPERVRGARELDPRGDVWSLGVTLYECLTGALPVEAETPLGMMFQVAFGAPVPLERRAPETPGDLADLVRACLSADPLGRPASAGVVRDLLAALSRAARGTNAVPAPPGDDRELRLVMAVFARSPRDPSLLNDLIRDAGAEPYALPQGALALFGRTRWRESVPLGALALARAAALTSAAVSIVSAKVLQGGGLPQRLVDAAAAALPPRGIGLDEGSATLLRGRCTTHLADGRRSIPVLEHDGEPLPPVAPFVGREADLAWLLDLTDGATAHQRSAAALLTGPLGIGRTRLMEEALRRARAGRAELHMLRARCDAAAADAPLSGLRSLLGERLHPRVASVLWAPSPSGDPQTALDRARAHVEGVLAALASDAPVLLAIDDAQWLDPTSRAVLRSVFDGAPGLPVAVWLFARGGHELVARVHGETRHRELPRLATHDARALLRGLGVGDDDRAAAIEARADGVPGALEALAMAPADVALPLDVEAAVRAQLDRLPAGPRDFLARAAVFGRVFWRDGVAALGGPEGVAAPSLRGWIVERRRARLDGGGEFEFRSGLAAEAARETLAPDVRRALHGLAGAWLTRFPEALPEELAAHWEAAGDAPRAAAQWVEATERRGACGAAESACRAAAEALRHPLDARSRWRVLRSRDDALQLSGDRALQRAGLDAMAALAAELGADAEAELSWRIIHHARMVGDASLARSAAARLAADQERSHARWGAVGWSELALLEADQGRLDGAHDAAARAVALAARVDDAWVAARAVHAQAYVDVERGDDLPGALARYAEAGDGYERAGDLRREAITLVNRAATLALLGRFAEALDLLGLAIDRARAVGNLRSVAVCLENRGSIRRALGDLEAAEDDLAEALSRAQTIGHPRLAEAACVERLYLAVASGAPAAVLAVRLAEVEARVDAAGANVGVASAVSASLRARERLDARDAGAVGRARALVVALAEHPMQIAELSAALWAADGRRAEDLARYREALERCVSGAADPHDRAVRLRALERRWLIPTAHRSGG